jgi:thiamine transport system substrate-binding protein
MPAEEDMLRDGEPIGRRALAALSIVVLSACGAGDEDTAIDTAAACWTQPSDHEPISLEDVDAASISDSKLTLVAYDSFWVSEGILETFEAETGIAVEVLTTADTGSMVSQAILNSANPIGDVMWGVDNTFLCRALINDIFVPYETPALVDVHDELLVDPQHRVTPVDFSDLCINYRLGELSALGLQPPRTLGDLRRPEYAAALVTENPETSPSGMGLLLASIAEYGEDGWEDFWRDLAEGGVAVEASWSEAYNGRFAPGSGDRAMVMSYATSPVYELLNSESELGAPPTQALLNACFRSIEFAGVLAGTDNPRGAALLVDFLVSTTMQEDLPLSMYVFPANKLAQVPDEFTKYASVPREPITVAPDVIEANRDSWTDRWTDIVLR